MYICSEYNNIVINNLDFWTSIGTVISEGFTSEGLIKLDWYAEQFISGQLIYKRFSPIEQYGCSKGGSCYVTEGVSDFKREVQRGAQQALIIEKWAKSVGVWTDNVEQYLHDSLGEEIAETTIVVIGFGRNAEGDPEIYLSDMHDENVIKSNAGTFFVVDCDIRINTPEFNQGGIRSLTTEVEFLYSD